jgi:hypothetical protein
MLFIKHLGRQAAEILTYCWENEVVWPIPLVTLLFLAALTAVGSQAVAPYIYALF